MPGERAMLRDAHVPGVERQPRRPPLHVHLRGAQPRAGRRPLRAGLQAGIALCNEQLVQCGLYRGSRVTSSRAVVLCGLSFPDMRESEPLSAAAARDALLDKGALKRDTLGW